MKRGIWIGLLATLAFFAILIARLPASWFAGFLPEGLSCSQITGTVWNGACAGLATPAGALGDLGWQIQASRLWSGTVGSHVAMQGPATSLEAEVTVSPDGTVDARNVNAHLSLERAALPQLPKELRGQAHAELARVVVTKGAITSLEGRIEVRNLSRARGRIRGLGDFRLSFPSTRAQGSGSEPVGDLDSIGGPWSLEGTLRLTPEPGFVVDGHVAAAPGSSAETLQELEFLGPADANGRRPFSLAGTF
jgi:general secretion pathway protein N